MVAPGLILNERIASLKDEARQSILRAVPIQRIGLPTEVGQTASWLCSDEASTITGATLLIDGGWKAGAAGY